MSGTQALTGERADLLESLARTRYFLRHTTRDLTEEQAAQRTTASELCLGGLIKHVTLTERQWIRFIEVGPSVMAWDQSTAGDWLSAFRMVPGDTLTACWRSTRRPRRRRPIWWPGCPTWTPPSRCPRLPGSRRGPAGRRAGCCCT